jgi:predicted ATPase/DNA-binding CsgD family transcriptional regulator
MRDASAAATGITARERDVWRLVAAHLTNKEIAEHLHLSVRTVESHVSSLMQKMQLPDRRALARQAALANPERLAAGRWPAPASSFVGREAEGAALLDAIAAHRMVTATGPGGVGKTRLTLRAVEAFAATRRDGACFVDLVHLSDPAMLMGAIAASTGTVVPLGGCLVDAVARTLAGSDAVLLLDNCEHVIDAVRDAVAPLLAACPSLAIVATSRVPLRAPFEWVFPVPPLSLGDGSGDAVALFVERARAAGTQTALDAHRIAELCAGLDGMALAIELAAARCAALGLDGLIAGLSHALRMLSSGAGAEHRHRSLRAAIAWSWQLLPPFDRGVLDALSVFASWFDVDAAQAVADPAADRFEIADALARLADHNLLVVAAGEPTHYRALQTIRQFGAEQLDKGGRRAAVADRHRQWCRAALQALAAQPRDDVWCERLDALAADVHAAVAWAAQHPCGTAAALLAEHLAQQLLLRGQPHESQRGYEQAAALSEATGERARLLRLAAGAAASRLVGTDTLRLLDDAAACALAAGSPSTAAEDQAWRAIFLRWAPGIIAERPGPEAAERWLAQAALHAGGAPAAEAAMAAATAVGMADDDPRLVEMTARAIALARAAGTPLIEGVALDVRCTLQLSRNELGRAIDEIDARETVMEGVALDAWTAYHFNDWLLMASEVHLAAGRLRQAAEYADRLGELACYRDYPHPTLARRLKVDAMAGDFEAAVAGGERFLAAWERAGQPISGTLGPSTYALAMVHGLLGDEASRARWIVVTGVLIGDPERLATCETAWAPSFDAMLALHRGQPDVALARLGADIDDRSVFRSSVAHMWLPWYAALWAEAAVLAGHADAAARLQRSAHATRENPIAAALVARAADLLHGRRDALRAHAQTFAGLGCDYQRRRTEALRGLVT